ncbi:hypothetical protein R6Q57_013419 [Mikania cordata]
MTVSLKVHTLPLDGDDSANGDILDANFGDASIGHVAHVGYVLLSSVQFKQWNYCSDEEVLTVISDCNSGNWGFIVKWYVVIQCLLHYSLGLLGNLFVMLSLLTCWNAIMRLSNHSKRCLESRTLNKKTLVMFYPFSARDMDSSRGQNGIQLLLAAEQEAQQIVNAARNAKLARLKQAKEEAEKEVAEFRAQMEADFQRKLTESSGDSGANVKRLEKETDAKIEHLKTEAERISSDVVEMLLKHVTSVRFAF